MSWRHRRPNCVQKSARDTNTRREKNGVKKREKKLNKKREMREREKRRSGRGVGVRGERAAGESERYGVASRTFTEPIKTCSGLQEEGI